MSIALALLSQPAQSVASAYMGGEQPAVRAVNTAAAVKGEDVFAVVLDTYIIAVDERDAGFLRGAAEKPVPFAVFVDAEGGAGDVA